MARLNLATGDTFYATITPEGGIVLHRTIQNSSKR